MSIQARITALTLVLLALCASHWRAYTAGQQRQRDAQAAAQLQQATITQAADGTPVKMGQKTNPTRALVDLLRDATRFEQAVKRCAPVPMHPYEFQAYASFTYNVGETAFCNSTLVKKLKVGDYEGACKELLKWDKVKGVTVKSLTSRRQAEYRICTGEGEST